MRNFSILCVDDNPANLQLLDRAFFDEGYIVYIAKSGQQAIEIAKEKIPDLILLDIAMPGMDGFAVLQELRSIPETSDIIVIFVTAIDENEEMIRGLSLGAVDYVVKPIDFKEFLPKVSNILQLKAQNEILNKEKNAAQNIMKVQTKLYTFTLDELINKLTNNGNALEKLSEEISNTTIKTEIEKIKSDNAFVLNRLEKLEMRSKIINNSVTANYSKFDLDLLIKAAVGIYAPLAKQKSVTMIYENPGNHIVYADRKLIEVTIDNLLSNAVKFTPHGGDIIIDASDYPENPQKYTQVTVYDTGSGLSPEQVATIFSDENFVKDENGKNGLGLGIAYHFVKLCKGKIWVESMPGIGSDFKFIIPKSKI